MASAKTAQLNDFLISTVTVDYIFHQQNFYLLITGKDMRFLDLSGYQTNLSH